MTAFLSKKFQFYSFVSMVLLVFVHGYNLHNRYLQPWTSVDEPLTFNSFTQYFLSNGLFRFRIPMLFAISGYLFALHDGQPRRQRLIKRLRTLMLPYLLWSIIGLLIAVLYYNFPATREAVLQTHLQPSDKTFQAYTFGDWIGAVLWPTSFQLWFLRCLFVYNMLYPLLLKGVLKIPAVLFTIFTLLWLATFGIILIEGEGLLFFTLGIWLCKRKQNLERTPRWVNLGLFTFLFIVACAAKTVFAFKAGGLGELIFPIMIVLHKLAIALGLIVVWFGGDSVVKYFMNKRWFVQVSAFSFMIYALHVPVINYLIDPMFRLLDATQHYRFITFIILPTLIIAFCIGVGWLLRTFVPSAYSILTGGRGKSATFLKTPTEGTGTGKAFIWNIRKETSKT